VYKNNHLLDIFQFLNLHILDKLTDVLILYNKTTITVLFFLLNSTDLCHNCFGLVAMSIDLVLKDLSSLLILKKLTCKIKYVEYSYIGFRSDCVFYNTTDRIAKNELLGLYYNYIFYILCADPINIEEVAEGLYRTYLFKNVRIGTYLYTDPVIQFSRIR
jgi:hypothetical protein